MNAHIFNQASINNDVSTEEWSPMCVSVYVCVTANKTKHTPSSITSSAQKKWNCILNKGNVYFGSLL